jgi:hypothetical protein
LLARENRLSSSDEIRQVIRLGKRSSNEFATIHFLPAETSRFAMLETKSVAEPKLFLVSRLLESHKFTASCDTDPAPPSSALMI